ncbi:MAG: hypothetical protein J2P27_18315, partial [Actinobacteria bacterium]|nr:hypothetical protein [Actinomycetota bacterium]
KTSLAATAALQLRDRFCDGQLYAELGGVGHPRDPQDVLGEMLRAMGIPSRSIPEPGPARAAMYRSLLASRKVLVIADDAAAAAQIRPLVPAAGGAAVLVTSRGRLSGLAGATTVQLGDLATNEALALLTAAAGPGRVAESPAAARAIVAACGSLPLAVRLAAVALAQRPGLPLARLAAELTSGRVLDILAAEDTSVAEAIGTSYRAVSPLARAALCSVAWCVPGDVPAWALAEIAAGDRKVADQLTAAGLLAPVQAELTGVHYVVHPLTRSYARARQPMAQGTAAQIRLRAGWLRGCQRAVTSLPAVPFLSVEWCITDAVEARDAFDGEIAAAWLDRERANLVAAAEQASAAGAHREAIALASGLTARLCSTGRHDDAIDLWRVITSHAAQADEITSATADYYLAAALAHAGEQADTAARLLAGCLPILEKAGAAQAAALGWCLAGWQASADQRHAAAINRARHAMELSAERPGGDLVRCAALTVLGLTLARVGACGTALRHCRQARDDARSMHEPVYEAHATKALAQVLILNGDYDQAAAMCADAISLARGYGSEVEAAKIEMVLRAARQGAAVR